MKNIISAFLFVTSFTFGQERIILTDQVLQIDTKGSKDLFFAFTKGDQLVLNVSDVKSKSGVFASVREFGSEVLWAKEVRNSENYSKAISKETIYHIRIENKANKNASVKVKLERLFSGNSGKKFNSTIKWMDQFDTTYTVEERLITVYDTSYITSREKEWKYSQREELIVEKNQKVNSTYTVGKDNKALVSIKLPDNYQDSMNSRRIVSWAYWVGVGEEANEQWKSNVKLIGTITKTVAGFYTSPLGALLLGQVTELAIPKSGEDVIYKVMDQPNYQLFKSNSAYKTIDKGQSTAAFKQLLENKYQKGTFYFYLENDNRLQDILVNIKIVAIIETGVAKWVEARKMLLQPREEMKSIKVPHVTVNRIPVIQK